MAENAGTSGISRGARITGESRDKLRDELKAQYEGGASIRTLAEQTGRSYGFVHNVLVEAGVTLRRRGGPNRRKRTE